MTMPLHRKLSSRRLGTSPKRRIKVTFRITKPLVEAGQRPWTIKLFRKKCRRIGILTLTDIKGQNRAYLNLSLVPRSSLSRPSWALNLGGTLKLPKEPSLPSSITVQSNRTLLPRRLKTLLFSSRPQPEQPIRPSTDSIPQAIVELETHPIAR